MEDNENKIQTNELSYNPTDFIELLDTNSKKLIEEEKISLILNGNPPYSLFKKVSKYDNEDIPYPTRQTLYSAGYDMVAAEDTIIPPYAELIKDLKSAPTRLEPLELSDISALTKATGARPTLIPTGYKCYLRPGTYLELSIRSSSPLKHWLILANGTGKIDADYVDNSDNEGAIYFQVINLSPFPIKINKGEAIGQAIVTPYVTLEADLVNPKIRNGGFGSTTNETSST